MRVPGHRSNRGEPLVALASQALDLIRILYDDFRNGRDEL